MDFAYIFSKFCRFYHVTDTHVLAMPLYRFWAMYWQIGKIEAEDDIRAISNLAAVNGGKEPLQERIKALEELMGTPVKVNQGVRTDYDPDGISRLKRLAG